MSRYFAHLRDLLWTLRFGDWSAVDWPWYLRIMPVAILLVWEAGVCNLAWRLSHSGGDTIMLDAVSVTTMAYLIPLIFTIKFGRR